MPATAAIVPAENFYNPVALSSAKVFAALEIVVIPMATLDNPDAIFTKVLPTFIELAKAFFKASPTE
jgi:hypothetical protein